MKILIARLEKLSATVVREANASRHNGSPIEGALYLGALYLGALYLDTKVPASSRGLRAPVMPFTSIPKCRDVGGV